jgi:hypothetical protein
MSDTAPRNPSAAPRLLADALLRTAGGSTALLRMTPASPGGVSNEVGLAATAYIEVPLSPVVIRKLQPDWQEDGEPKQELLVSASAVEQEVRALDIASAQALFAMALTVTVGGRDYLIDSISANEAFGQTYVYRLLVREARQQAL